MPQYEVTCWGGPLDGLLIERQSAPPNFVWLTPVGRMYRAPREGTEPYRLAGRWGNSVAGHYARLNYAGSEQVCARCGTHHHSISGPAACLLCGGVLRAIHELVRRTAI